jgi:hypothetical protein
LSVCYQQIGPSPSQMLIFYNWIPKPSLKDKQKNWCENELR